MPNICNDFLVLTSAISAQTAGWPSKRSGHRAPINVDSGRLTKQTLNSEAMDNESMGK